MKFNWFPLLILLVLTSGFLEAQKTDRPAIQFNKILDGYTLTTLLGLSLDDCWKNCEQRAACMSINYERKTHMCQLNSDAEKKTPTKRVGYVFLEKPNYTSEVECGSNSCNDGEACDSETKTCTKKECNPPEESDETHIDGNLLATGSKRRIRCKPGFAPLNENKFSVTTECEDGEWNKQLECGPLTCKRLADAEMAVSGMYKSYDEGSQETIDIFCDFGERNDIGYTFLASNTLSSDINISNYYTRRDHVMLRHVRDEGQYQSKMEVLPKYRNDYNVSIFISAHPDFPGPTSFVKTPYMYMGFVPSSFGNRQYKTMGYTGNEENYTFNNSNNHENNYFAIFESPKDSSNTTECYNNVGVVRNGWMVGSKPVSTTLPKSVFLDSYEIHMGGSGCLIQNCYDTVHGMAFGLPFDY